MNAIPPTRSLEKPSPGIARVGITFVALTLLLVLWQTRMTLLIWALDGALALTIVMAATLAGYVFVAALRLSPLQLAWRYLLSAGLGIGFLATLTLICGSAGWVGASHRWVCPALLAVFAIAGLVLMVRSRDVEPITTAGAGPICWLVLAAVPFAAMILIVATAPPGVLWQEEGRGYDVLEYHLQLPKEYYNNGAITYLPHNVYANFPANAEMLYLFANVVTGEGVESWSVSKCINALLGGLFVCAAWLVGRRRSKEAGIVAGVLAAATGWVTYLSGVAYVENGMLLMGMLACGCVGRAAALDDRTLAIKWCVLAGIFAGFACGFKYTACVLIALPLVVLMLIALRGNFVRRLVLVVIFGVASLVTFAPWLVKNIVMTGNPVFPLLGSVFTSYPTGWGAEEAAHFTEAHAPAPEEATLSARLSALTQHVVLEKPQRFGAILLVLAAAGLVRHRTRHELGLAAMLLVQSIVWLFATHLYARFAVPMLIPLLLLACAGASDDSGKVRLPFVLLVITGVSFNLLNTGTLYARHYYTPNHERMSFEGGSVLFTAGILPGEHQLATINTKLPADAKILLIGEARAFYFLRDVDYCVVFNRNAFNTVAEQSPTLGGIIDWLRKRGYTHVYVDWTEVGRLRHSRYGFPEAITTSLFEQLEDEGLKRVEDYNINSDESNYATLYAVPQ